MTRIVYMDRFRQDFFETLESFGDICVFRHTNPDGDAQGSQWGLVLWLKERYPDKNIYACGFHLGTYQSYYPTIDQVEDEIIAKSCAVILDCANRERIDDQRYQMARKIIKIDHHPDVDRYASLEYVNPKASSTCEILCDLLRLTSEKPLSKQVAQYLFTGLLTDTLRLTTRSTTAHTFECAAYLVSSDLDVSAIHQSLFSLDVQDFKAGNCVRSHAQIQDSGLVYSLLDDQIITNLGIHPSIIKNRVNDLGNVREFKVWALCLELREEGQLLWSASLRSNNITINHIAQKYGGGGHPNACAVRGLTRLEIEKMLIDLENCIQ